MPAMDSIQPTHALIFAVDTPFPFMFEGETTVLEMSTGNLPGNA